MLLKNSEKSTLRKFENLKKTQNGKDRAAVHLNHLETLWFNTGTVCNLSCENCYIESSPTNDTLSYITLEDVMKYLDEIKEQKLATRKIGFTGGEPFINPHFLPILAESLSRGFEIIVLTNALRPMENCKSGLLKLKKKYSDQLVLRVSLDHYKKEVHETQRGPHSFDRTINNLQWLAENEFNFSIAGRSLKDEPVQDAIQGYQQLFTHHNIAIDVKENLTVFPEMDLLKETPEISVECWDILGKKPDDLMCAKERMIIKRKGHEFAEVFPCTLITQGKDFELGKTLKEASKNVYLNHPFCSQFCVLGGASCSGSQR